MFCPKTLAGASSPLSAELMSAEKSAPRNRASPTGGRYSMASRGTISSGF